jgi:hypothetical protein
MEQRPGRFDSPATPLDEHQIPNSYVLFECHPKALSRFCLFTFSVGFAVGCLVVYWQMLGSFFT